MKEEKLTLDNYWYHPRFWRHSIAWLFLLLFLLISEPSNSSTYHIDEITESIVTVFMYIFAVYPSFHLYERFYKKQKRIIFFLCHIPIFIIITTLGRATAFYLGLDYSTDIWVEIVGWPITMLIIYLIKFSFHGLKTRRELNKLQSQLHHTALSLTQTQINPQFLIRELQQIHKSNLQNTEIANEAILELSDHLRQRIDTDTSKEVTIKTDAVPLSNKIEKEKYGFTSNRLKRHLLVWLAFIVYISANHWNQHSGEISSFVLTYPNKIAHTLLYPFLIYPSIYYYKKWFINKKHLQFIFTQIVLLFSFLGFVFGLSYILLGSKVPDGTLVTLLLRSCAVLFGAYLIQISYNFFRDSSTVQTLSIKQTETELKLLKAQINPHFLFNVLNNIYGTNLDNNSKANEYLQGLINLLQYQSNSQKKTFIDLEEEIQLVKSYIELEKARVYNCNVTITEQGNFSDFKIIPLLLLPIIENAFKYDTGLEKGEIHITFEQINNQFNFTCSNTIQPNKKQKTSTGIGIDNVQKRLAIKYPKKHKFTIDRTQKIFTAKITITL